MWDVGELRVCLTFWQKVLKSVYAIFDYGILICCCLFKLFVLFALHSFKCSSFYCQFYLRHILLLVLSSLLSRCHFISTLFQLSSHFTISFTFGFDFYFSLLACCKCNWMMKLNGIDKIQHEIAITFVSQEATTTWRTETNHIFMNNFPNISIIWVWSIATTDTALSQIHTLHKRMKITQCDHLNNNIYFFSSSQFNFYQ